MMERLINLPTYSSITTHVDASHFNAIRRATLKAEHVLRIRLYEFDHVDLLIDHDSWVCVDRNNNDMPLVAWLNFATQQRSTLHTPVQCQKNYYHFSAAKIAHNALNMAMEHLAQTYAPAPACRLQAAAPRIWKTTNQAVLTCV